MSLTCFKAYDIRGQLGEELNADIAYRIGRAYAEILKPERVVVGRDVRFSSEELCAALVRGLCDGGVDVFDIGLCGTEEIYHATFSQGYDGGIMVTASHNPLDYNGMKLVREEARPISGDTGLDTIRNLAEKGVFEKPVRSGQVSSVDLKQSYVEHLLGYIDVEQLKPCRIVVNAGNGCAGPIIDRLQEHLPFEIVKIQHVPDGSFPNGIPNPLLPENRSATRDAVLDNKADLGIAWDGDFDRCFLFDEHGNFIEGYYIVGLLAEAFLQKNPGGTVIHDPRLTWNSIDIIEKAGGVAVQSKTGHAFIKERMRTEDAVYGGEMSAHHYFKDFSYCDSGMIPWLLVTELMASQMTPLSGLVGDRIAKYPASGEINKRLSDPDKVINSLQNHYSSQAIYTDYTDGLSMEFLNWRFNVRKSNTEPLVRLNVESRHDVQLMEQKTTEILALLK